RAAFGRAAVEKARRAGRARPRDAGAAHACQRQYAERSCCAEAPERPQAETARPRGRAGSAAAAGNRCSSGAGAARAARPSRNGAARTGASTAGAGRGRAAALPVRDVVRKLTANALRARRGARGHQLARPLAPRFMIGELVAVEVEHEETYGRRQVAVLSLRIDRGDQVRQRHVAPAGNLLEPFPERILEAHAGLVAGNDDRPFDDRRFHHSSPVSIRWRSRSRWALTLRLASSLRSALLRPCSSRLADAVRSARCRSARLRALRRLTMSPIPHSMTRSGD